MLPGSVPDEISIKMEMIFTVEKISKLINGSVEGNGQLSISGISKIEQGIEGTLTFLANPIYESHIYTTKASAALVSNDFKPKQALPETLTLIRVENPYLSFASLLDYYQQLSKPKPGINPMSFIDEGTKPNETVHIGAFVSVGKNVIFGKNVVIYPNCVISDNCVIGDDTIIFSGVVIYHNCKIGNFCTIHSGCVIGADGFGFAPSNATGYKKVPQTGNVIIEDYVEVGANTTIDRATIGSTTIRKGVKIDNLVQIGHNVEVGEHTVIVSQTGISGSTKLGANCMIGGQVGMVGHIEIAEGTKIAAQSGVGGSIKTPGTIVQGSPAYEIRQYQRSSVVFKQLPDLVKRINELERIIQKLDIKNE